jgi:hypothetical protein
MNMFHPADLVYPVIDFLFSFLSVISVVNFFLAVLSVLSGEKKRESVVK